MERRTHTPHPGASPSVPGTHMKPGDEAPPGTPGTGENLCPDCSGRGRIGDRPCETCEGTGTVIQGVGGA
ncbi:MAG: hypothetical protein ACOZCP_13135 [Pseudomonadota bacterium]